MLPSLGVIPALLLAVPSDADIRAILAQRVDQLHQSLGIVVGVIDPRGRRVISYGQLDRGDTRALDGDTVFEIGSVTKVFTSLALADMVERGEVALDDPISKYLPEGVTAPRRGGRSITLRDLATHSSGLPRMPSNFRPKDSSNPYADYTAAQLYEFLSTCELKRDIGSEVEYSNLGAGLLGHLLARRAGASYEELVRSRICRLLGMASTGITVSPEIERRLAVGHGFSLKPVPRWDFQALAGCGALRSTANDLLKFLAASLGYTASPLDRPLAAMLAQRRPAKSLGGEIGLAWIIYNSHGREIVWHNGGTYGFRSFVGYDRAARAGVVVLSNTFTMAGIDDIGMHLLDPDIPLKSQ